MKVKKSESKKIGLIALTVLSVIALAACLTACNPERQHAETKSYVTVDINPSVEMVLDKNNVVLSVAAANSDAEVLLWEEEGIVGAKVDAAVGKIAAAAVELGFIQDENKNVSVTVSAGASVNTEELYNTVKTSFVSAVNKIDETLKITVNNSVDLVLKTELDAVKADNVGKEGYDSLTVAKYRLVKRAMAADRSLKMDAAVKMSTDELSAVVETAQSDAKAKLGEAFRIAEREAKFAFDIEKQRTLDSIYIGWQDIFFPNGEQIYQDRTPQERLSVGLKGVHYTYLKSAYAYLEHYYTILRDYLDDPVYTAEDAQAVINAMGTAIDATAWEDFKTKYADEKGNITSENLKSFINKIYRNLPEENRAAFESAYADAKAEMDKLDASITVEKTDENGLINTFEIKIKSAEYALDVSIDYVDYSDVETVLAMLREKIDYTYASMNLTEQEKARIKTAQEELQADIDSLYETFQKAIENAQNVAVNALNSLKEARLSVEA